jgi:predicted nucleic acid-binding protein
MIRGLLPVQPLTIYIHETGLALAERFGLSIYDAMIAASALHVDCGIALVRRYAGRDLAR